MKCIVVTYSVKHKRTFSTVVTICNSDSKTLQAGDYSVLQQHLPVHVE